MEQPLFFEQHDRMAIHAKDPEGLHHIATYTQDALFAPTAINFNPERQHVKILLNRFRWEQEPYLEQGTPVYARVHSALLFRHVETVDHHGWEHDAPLRMVNLLSVKYAEGYIYLYCSEHVTFRLKTAAIECYLIDLDDHWPTHVQPNHSLEEWEKQFDDKL